MSHSGGTQYCYQLCVEIIRLAKLIHEANGHREIKIVCKDEDGEE